MKKNILSTTIALLLSVSASSVVAETSDWEKELDAMSIGAEVDNIDIEGIGIDDIDMGSILMDLDDNTEELNHAENIELGLESNEPIVEDKETVEIVKKEVAPIEFSEPEGIKELTEHKPSEMTSSKDYVFLKFVPEGTRLTVGSTYKILPKKRYIIFHNGERVPESPQKKNDLEKTFCFIELKPSGTARVLKEGKQLTVTKTKSTVYDHDIKKSYGDYKLRTHEVSFEVDNPSIKSLTCYSAQSYMPGSDKTPRPLMIKDLREQSGDVFTIDFPAYEEI